MNEKSQSFTKIQAIINMLSISSNTLDLKTRIDPVTVLFCFSVCTDEKQFSALFNLTVTFLNDVINCIEAEDTKYDEAHFKLFKLVALRNEKIRSTTKEEIDLYKKLRIRAKSVITRSLGIEGEVVEALKAISANATSQVEALRIQLEKFENSTKNPDIFSRFSISDNDSKAFTRLKAIFNNPGDDLFVRLHYEINNNPALYTTPPTKAVFKSKSDLQKAIETFKSQGVDVFNSFNSLYYRNKDNMSLLQIGLYDDFFWSMLIPEMLDELNQKFPKQLHEVLQNYRLDDPLYQKYIIQQEVKVLEETETPPPVKFAESFNQNGSSHLTVNLGRLSEKKISYNQTGTTTADVPAKPTQPLKKPLPSPGMHFVFNRSASSHSLKKSGNTENLKPYRRMEPIPYMLSDLDIRVGLGILLREFFPEVEAPKDKKLAYQSNGTHDGIEIVAPVEIKETVTQSNGDNHYEIKEDKLEEGVVSKENKKVVALNGLEQKIKRPKQEGHIKTAWRVHPKYSLIPLHDLTEFTTASRVIEDTCNIHLGKICLGISNISGSRHYVNIIAYKHNKDATIQIIILDPQFKNKEKIQNMEKRLAEFKMNGWKEVTYFGPTQQFNSQDCGIDCLQNIEDILTPERKVVSVDVDGKLKLDISKLTLNGEKFVFEEKIGSEADFDKLLVAIREKWETKFKDKSIKKIAYGFNTTRNNFNPNSSAAYNFEANTIVLALYHEAKAILYSFEQQIKQYEKITPKNFTKLLREKTEIPTIDDDGLNAFIGELYKGKSFDRYQEIIPRLLELNEDYPSEKIDFNLNTPFKMWQKCIYKQIDTWMTDLQIKDRNLKCVNFSIGFFTFLAKKEGVNSDNLKQFYDMYCNDNKESLKWISAYEVIFNDDNWIHFNAVKTEFSSPKNASTKAYRNSLLNLRTPIGKHGSNISKGSNGTSSNGSNGTSSNGHHAPPMITVHSMEPKFPASPQAKFGNGQTLKEDTETRDADALKVKLIKALDEAIANLKQFPQSPFGYFSGPTRVVREFLAKCSGWKLYLEKNNPSPTTIFKLHAHIMNEFCTEISTSFKGECKDKEGGQHHDLLILLSLTKFAELSDGLIKEFNKSGYSNYTNQVDGQMMSNYKCLWFECFKEIIKFCKAHGIDLESLSDPTLVQAETTQNGNSKK